MAENKELLREATYFKLRTKIRNEQKQEHIKQKQMADLILAVTRM